MMSEVSGFDHNRLIYIIERKVELWVASTFIESIQIRKNNV